ncbi:hypothetical protein D3C79_1085660 [compost metagenome]
MHTTGNQTGDVSHVDHQICTNFVGDLTEAFPVPDTGIGSTASKNQLWLVFTCKARNFFHV